MNSWSLTSLTAASGLLILTSLLLWWVIRIRLQKLRLPVLRILNYKPSQKPKLSVQVPPWIPFLCFLALSMTFLFLTVKPSQTVYRPFSTEGATVHIFADMSPSVSGQLSLKEYTERITSLWEKLNSSKSISFSTTHNDEIWTADTPEQLQEKVYTLGYHRAGTALGSAVKQQWQQISKTDRFIVISDQDAHSWQNFDWQYLSKETELWYLNISGSSQSGNFFFHKAQYLSPPVAKLMDWDISIARRGSQGTSKGILRVSWADQQLSSVPWEFAPGQNSLTLRVSWPSGDIEDLKRGESAPLIWELIPDQRDSITMDNSFRTSLLGVEQKVILVAEAGGEQILESPTYSLQMSQEILGIRPERFDSIRPPGPPATDYPLWILFIDEKENIETSCPASLHYHRRQETTMNNDRPVQVWLSPYLRTKEAYQNICWCYHRLLVSQSPSEEMPSFCKEIHHIAGYADVLKSIGAAQVGGTAGEESQAIAWEGTDPDQRLRVMAFTVPLRPDRKTGLTHHRLPLVVQSLLSLGGMNLKSSSPDSPWKRIADNSQMPGWQTGQKASRTERYSLVQSNVPEGESELRKAPGKIFPPAWPDVLIGGSPVLNQQKKHQDPLPWIYGLFIFILCIVFIEICYSVIKKRQFNPGNSAKRTLLVFFALATGDLSWGSVTLNLLGFQKNIVTMKDLSYQVSNRTSLSLSEELIASPVLQSKSLTEGWIWASSPGVLQDKNGHLLTKAGEWVRRGGFLIIENAPDPLNLAKLTEKGFHYLFPPGHWHPIPPDHEVMRSFYLLDSLPACNKGLWYGFRYDRRLSILAIPYKFLQTLNSRNRTSVCGQQVSHERSVRIFINTLMVALTTDYKKDQIHMREILKRLK